MHPPLDGPQKSLEPQTGQTFASTEQPSSQTGQTVLQTTGQPIIAEKGKTTITSSQVEAAPAINPEPLYAVVKKPRTKTHSNLDRDGAQRPVQSSSSDLPDWVVIEASTSKTEDNQEPIHVQEQPQIQPASPIQTTPAPAAPVPAARTRVTKTPDRKTFLPQSPSMTSTPTHSSSLPTPSTAAETSSLPSTDVKPSASAQAIPSTLPAVQYRALYAYDAVDQSEVSFQEEDTLTAVPGEDSAGGWVKVEVKGQTGWAPETYLERVWPSGGGGGGGVGWEDGRGGGDGGGVKGEEERTVGKSNHTPTHTHTLMNKRA